MILRGLVNHLLLTLRLNLRSKQAMVYGYLVPIFFLLAFGSVFRSGSPRLLHQMGQLITISVLGGACFGMPTSLVAERERGVWRRYRLLPAGTGTLVGSTMIARFLIVGSAAVMQIVLARIIYGTPWPRHPFGLLIAFVFVTFAFLGMGLVIAALADNVPAVQAAWTGDFFADDFDRRGWSAAGRTAGMGAASGWVFAGTVCGGGAGFVFLFARDWKKRI